MGLGFWGFNFSTQLSREALSDEGFRVLGFTV